MKFRLPSGRVQHNLTPEALADHALASGQVREADSGALAVDTGEFTGRSPADRFLVRDPVTENEVWWNSTNLPFSPEAFDRLQAKLLRSLEGKEYFVQDGALGASSRYRTRVRVVAEWSWIALFVHNLFLRLTDKQQKLFEPDWTVCCVPSFRAAAADGTRQHNFTILNFTSRIVLIGGSAYPGEIKKAMFSALNFLLPVRGDVLPMHCSANVGPHGDTALFFGLSGTGKTTLSTDPDRGLIGDDEHGWASDGEIFNFEGGCYAKTIDLTEEKEPGIYHAIRRPALLENVGFFPGSNRVNFADRTRTENTRVSYPLGHIPGAVEPSVGSAPRNVFFLTCDAHGVLPPIARLTPGQAAYYFISGYTSKVAGTETGVIEPKMTFSTCFGAPFMPLHPARYASMLTQRLAASGSTVWLVNTGWYGGGYGHGKRMALGVTRALVRAALSGELAHSTFETFGVFGLAIPLSCPGVSGVLNPRQSWADPNLYDQKAKVLARSFLRNFAAYSEGVTPEILSGAPRLEEGA